eukprot:scaffold7204_cov354-Prasinococcus_capsulatus_cf.AAC.10
MDDLLPSTPGGPATNALVAARDTMHKVGNELKCALCLGIFREPAKLARCGHYFCKGCILQSLKARPQCPLCLQPAKPREVAPCDTVAKVSIPAPCRAPRPRTPAVVETYGKYEACVLSPEQRMMSQAPAAAVTPAVQTPQQEGSMATPAPLATLQPLKKRLRMVRALAAARAGDKRSVVAGSMPNNCLNGLQSMEEAELKSSRVTPKSADYVPPSLTYRQQLQMAMQLSKGSPEEKAAPAALFPRFADLADKKRKKSHEPATPAPRGGEDVKANEKGLIHWGITSNSEVFETPEQENDSNLANQAAERNSHLPVRKRFFSTTPWNEHGGDDHDGDDGIQCAQPLPSASRTKGGKARAQNSSAAGDVDATVAVPLCSFCNLGAEARVAGPLLQHAEGKGRANSCYVHEECALWAPNAYYSSKEKLVGVLSEVARGRRLKCTECNKCVDSAGRSAHR